MPSSFNCVSACDNWLLRLEVENVDRAAARITSPIVSEIISSISVKPRTGLRLRGGTAKTALTA
ncbi:hypothetical protein BKP43_15050 [Variovorax boronicumulans]|nr:hypothetical protein BKP43_15050 [Variovorax boronicumulans]